VRNSGPLLVTAFQNEAQTGVAIVAVNARSVAAQEQQFEVGSAAATVTPWVTSSELPLIEQPAVSVVGGRFSYTIPARAVVTFAAPNRNR
jgi:O-glycosyl hydrolase